MAQNRLPTVIWPVRLQDGLILKTVPLLSPAGPPGSLTMSLRSSRHREYQPMKSKNWPNVPLGEILKKSDRWIELDPAAQYKEVTVRLWGKGVILRREVS